VFTIFQKLVGLSGTSYKALDICTSTCTADEQCAGEPPSSYVRRSDLLERVRTQGSCQIALMTANDPLWRLFSPLGSRLGWISQIAIVTSGITLISLAAIIGGGIIVTYHLHPTGEFIGVLTPEHLPFALLSILVFSPGVWIAYLWQPLGTVSALLQLRENDVVSNADADTADEFIGQLMRLLGSKALSACALGAVVFVAALETLVVLPQEISQRGMPFFWYYDKYYYGFVFVPVAYVTCYAAATVVVKGVASLIGLHILFRRFRAKVHPMHRDGVGGLGPLGSLAVRYSLIGVGLGVIGTSLMVARILTGTKWLYTDTGVFIGVYAVLTPTALLLPLLSAHRAMVNARDELLDDLCKQFDSAVLALRAQPSFSRRSKTKWLELQVLNQRCAFIRDTYPTWPITGKGFRGFGALASLPGIVSALLGVATRLSDLL
jgi:hypothetical protein